ncbi:uncharacterized protein LOC141640856 [Silene latifolia]|uniref:uncharacterized protein LOC141640856 n=1 Tax=Silene latifolia TaxID=37657 RepID=UPI003D76ADAC
MVINKFLLDNNVGIFGLIETKIKPNNVNKAVNIFNNWSISTNSACHPGGRIWILWQANNYDVQFIEYDPQYIHMQITQKPENVSFNWTVVYAFNDSKDRESLWNNLNRIAGYTQGPWAVAGDFNCVLTADERIGGVFSRTDAEPFLNCIHQCELIDSPAMGAMYTGNNKQCPADRVYSKLDRWLINQEWQISYPDLIAQFLPEGLFDHTPCLVSNGSQQIAKVKPFKYFNMWSRALNFHEGVQEGWQCHNKGTKMFELVKKLKNLKPFLRGLNKSQFSDIEKNADIALTKLSRNSFIQFYTVLLGRSNPTVAVSKRVMSYGNKCEASHVQQLMCPVTNYEIKNVLFSIPNDKAPGPDGYSSQFFKASWDQIGVDFCEAIQNFSKWPIIETD